MIQTKRIYEDPSVSDGYRVLVDRLWPRGVSKEKADLGQWLKEVAPSTKLRKWYGHEGERFPEFKRRYEEELADNPAFDTLLALAREHKTLTLLYAAKSPKNEAAVLEEVLEARLDESG